MRTIVDLGYGRESLYQLYKCNNMSSRLLYGLAQLEEQYDIHHVSLDSRGGIRSLLANNIRALTRCDVLYVTYFFPLPLLLLALLRKLGFLRKRKIIVISHKTMPPATLLTRLVYDSLDMVFFHSQQNLRESVDNRAVKPEKAAFLNWGDDINYLDAHAKTTQGDYFLSTGREQRDYRILIDAFSRTDAKLALYTNKVNYDNNYEYLEKEKGKHKNIDITFVEKSVDTTQMLVLQAASCLCVVNPLLKEKVSYCVGLTSIVEAMALGKPIITSKNPYSPVDVEHEGIGFVADDEESWVKAVEHLNTHRQEAIEMGRRARRLAEQRFNINACAKQLNECIDHLFS